jgi:sulfate transport system permease protein
VIDSTNYYWPTWANCRSEVVDVPLALPTAVAGLVYSSLYVSSGWLGRFLVSLGIEGAYSVLAIVLVLTFAGLPFVVRTVQPVLLSLDADVEEAASSLGATRWQTFARVIWPALLPAALTGFALALGRALREYGSVRLLAGSLGRAQARTMFGLLLEPPKKVLGVLVIWVVVQRKL